MRPSDRATVIFLGTSLTAGLGVDPEQAYPALIQAVIDRIRTRDSTTLIALVQMEAMPNLGRRYVERFHAIYPELARTNRVLLVPFLLNGVAGIDSLNQADGIHPTPKGHQIVAETVWRALRPVLTELDRRWMDVR